MKNQRLVHDFLTNLLKEDEITVVFHEGGDADAVASAFLMKRFLESKGKKVDVLANTLTREGRKLKELLELKFSKEHGNSLLLVDFSSSELLREEITLKDKQVFIIDHHDGDLINVSKNSIIDKKAVATVEIIDDFFDVEWDKKVAYAFSLAILEDSNNLLNANKKTFKILEKSLDFVDYEELQRIRGLFLGKNERKEILIGMKNLKMYVLDGEYISITKTKTHERVLSNFLSVFSDVSIVFSESGGASITTRSKKITRSFFKKFDPKGHEHAFHINANFEEVIKYLRKRALKPL